MKESIYLGRIAGVRIGMNWSLLAIFGLIAWSLADGRFPYEYPGYTDGYYWAGGTLTAIVFFACLLAHEMGHALVARTRGVEVEGITLWLFGGVAKLKGDPKTARDELKIAIAGPLVSLALAGAFAGISAVLEASGSSSLLVGIVVWLWRINAMLAVFNMLPAFPLDGGRVFRALLWRWKGKTKATRWAARTGRTFGVLMISAGVVEFAVRQSFDGVWIAFLGYFLLNAATAEEQVIIARDALAGLMVGDAMSAAPVTVPGWITLDAFLDDFASQHHGQHFAVTAFDGSIRGVVGLDAVKRVRPEERSSTRTDRISIPIAEIIICEPSDLITGVLERMTGTGLGRALVFDDGRMVGALTAPDIKLVLDLVEMGARPRSESQS